VVCPGGIEVADVFISTSATRSSIFLSILGVVYVVASRAKEVCFIYFCARALAGGLIFNFKFCSVIDGRGSPCKCTCRC
jgi:hypothetical protein